MNSGNVVATKSQEKVLGAFLGAAIGDALGWPNEMPARRVRSNGSTDVDASNMFVGWHRRSGGQFMPHEEVISAGEYSDDTQLLLCGARSLLHGAGWLGHLVSENSQLGDFINEVAEARPIGQSTFGSGARYLGL